MPKPSAQAGADEIAADAGWQTGERHFRRLLEHLPAGAYTCDADGLITYYNAQAVALWGRAPKLNDPVDRFCGSFRLFAADGSPIRHDECWMALALRNGRAYNGEEILVERPDGSRLTALAHANPIHDDDGRLLGAVNVLVDISGRKRHEDLLHAADRSKNEFLATLAHELRNPLAPIRNVVQILQLKGVDREAGEALKVIDRQVQQMTRLIDDLLDLSRITQNRLQLRREAFDLDEALRAAIETARPLIDAGGHKLTVRRPKAAAVVNADLTRLAQVVANLLINAAKYTPSGGRIALSARRVRGDVVIAVRDNGLGIAPELLPRIFDLFTQGDHDGAATRDGLGIGLTLARRLTELHGGTLEASSAGPGRGAAFTLRLPIAVAAPAPAPEATAAPAEPVASLRVLVVDDNRASAVSLRTLLQLVGHEVRVAHDGQQALERAREFRPDAVLLDLGLPKINGYDVARRLRAAPWTEGVRLIAVTGWGQVADRERSRQAGCDHHLVKPVEPAQLLRLLERRTPCNGHAGGPHGGNGHWQGEEKVQIVSLPITQR